MKILGGLALFLFVISASLAQDKVRPSQPELPGDILIDFGFNLWSADVEELPLSTWGSNSVGIYYNKRFRISDRISFYGAGGFAFEKVAFESDYTWLRDESGVVELDSLSGVTLKKNKLVSTFFEIPVEFRIHPLKTVNGEGWFIGLGAVGGVKIANHTKVKYLLNDSDQKEKTYADFGLETWRYGVQLRFGFKTFHVFYKTYLNNMFNDAPTGEANPKMSTIGINFSGF